MQDAPNGWEQGLLSTDPIRVDLASSIVDEAMGPLLLPEDLASAIRDVLIDALLAHPDASLLLRRCLPDPQIERSDAVTRGDGVARAETPGQEETG